MCACTNIFTQIDTPKFRAIEFYTIYVYVARITSFTIVLAVTRIPLKYDFIFTITIYITNTTIVWAISASAFVLLPS